MTIRHLVEVGTTDELIIADQFVAFLSSLCLLIILIWVIYNFKKQKTVCHSLSISCMVSITGFLLFALIGSIGWTNVVFPISSLSCKITYTSGLISYNIAKISMYWLFTLRIETIFAESALALNTYVLWIYRIISAIIPSIAWVFWLYESFPDLKPHEIETYSYCFPINFRHQTFASHVAGVLAWSDLLFSGIALCIFVWKLYQVTQLANESMSENSSMKGVEPRRGTTQNSHSSSKKGLYYLPLSKKNSAKNSFRKSLINPTQISRKWIQIIRKSTVLCLIAILSTWVYVLGVAYILRQMGFFMSFDGVINALCLACLFNFGDDLYKFSCGGFEGCLIIICCCSSSTNNQHGNRKNKKKMTLYDWFRRKKKRSVELMDNGINGSVIVSYNIINTKQASEYMAPSLVTPPMTPPPDGTNSDISANHVYSITSNYAPSLGNIDEQTPVNKYNIPLRSGIDDSVLNKVIETPDTNEDGRNFKRAKSEGWAIKTNNNNNQRIVDYTNSQSGNNNGSIGYANSFRSKSFSQAASLTKEKSATFMLLDMSDDDDDDSDDDNLYDESDSDDDDSSNED